MSFKFWKRSKHEKTKRREEERGERREERSGRNGRREEDSSHQKGGDEERSERERCEMSLPEAEVLYRPTASLSFCLLFVFCSSLSSLRLLLSDSTVFCGFPKAPIVGFHFTREMKQNSLNFYRFIKNPRTFASIGPLLPKILLLFAAKNLWKIFLMDKKTSFLFSFQPQQHQQNNERQHKRRDGGDYGRDYGGDCSKGQSEMARRAQIDGHQLASSSVVGTRTQQLATESPTSVGIPNDRIRRPRLLRRHGWDGLSAQVLVPDRELVHYSHLWRRKVSLSFVWLFVLFVDVTWTNGKWLVRQWRLVCRTSSNLEMLFSLVLLAT